MLNSQVKVLAAVTVMTTLLVAISAQAPTLIPPHLKGNFSFDPPIFVDFFEGTTMRVLVSPVDCFADQPYVNLTIKLLDPRLAKVREIKPLPPGKPQGLVCPIALPGEDTSCWRFLVTFEAIQLGLSPTIMTIVVPPPKPVPAVASSSDSTADPPKAEGPVVPPRVNATILLDRFDLVVARQPRFLDKIFLLIMLIFVILLNFGFGCALNLELVFQIVKRPIAPAIGFACQFCIMPILSFIITSFMPIHRMLAFGLVVLGCCPGGGGSNVWTLLLKGNVDLSITMTFISICCSIFMMPFWLFMLARFYVDPTRVTVPYNEIFKTLGVFVVPCLIGVLVHKKKPQVADNFQKALKPLAGGFTIYLLTFGLYVNSYIYRMIMSYPLIVPAAFLLPWCGFGMGFSIATILRQPRPNAITIAIETGIQNYSIAMVVLLGAFPKPYGDLAAVMPMVVAHFTPLPLLIAFFVITIRDKMRKKNRKEPISDVDDKKVKSDEDGGEALLQRENEMIVRSDRSHSQSHSQGHSQGHSQSHTQIHALLPPPVNGGPANPHQEVRSWTFLEVGDGYIIGKKQDAYKVDKEEVTVSAEHTSKKDQVEDLWYKCLKESNI